MVSLTAFRSVRQYWRLIGQQSACYLRSRKNCKKLLFPVASLSSSVRSRIPLMILSNPADQSHISAVEELRPKSSPRETSGRDRVTARFGWRLLQSYMIKREVAEYSTYFPQAREVRRRKPGDASLPKTPHRSSPCLNSR